jgi:hypothetical protein
LVFAFHPSGLIPFPFGFLAATYAIAFFFSVFFFVKLYMCCAKRKRSTVQARAKADTNFKASIMHSPKFKHSTQKSSKRF